MELTAPRSFTVKVARVCEGIVTLSIGFGEPARNDVLVRDALAELSALNLAGGTGVQFNGPASLPVAMALCHAVSHLYGFVACFDPKLRKYVVAVSHDPAHRPGDLLAHEP